MIEITRSVTEMARSRRKIQKDRLKSTVDSMEGTMLGCSDSFDRDTDSTGTMKGAQSDSLVDSMSKGVRMEKILDSSEDEST